MKNEGKTALAHLTASAEKEFCAFLAQQTRRHTKTRSRSLRNAAPRDTASMVTGIGKPRPCAGYGASLLSSTGTPSYFLHGTEAVHGSCGQLEEGDVVIAISNSGETVELKATVLAVKNNGCRVIGITGNAESWLAKESDALLLAHVDEEGGPLNRAPRNSVLAEMFVLQALSAILQADVAQTPAQYVRRHPGGALGRIRDNER